MKCKICKNLIDDDSIFCKFCGEKQIRTKKEKTEGIKVPKPRQLSSGSWFAQLMINGERVSVSGSTEAEYYAKARAAKQGMIEISKAPKRITLEECCTEYIDKRSNVLSPATVSGYKRIMKYRFQAYMKKDIHEIDYQEMINQEDVGAKTLKNSFGLVRSALDPYDIKPKVRLPQVVHKDAKWLDAAQVKLFLKALNGKPEGVQIGALLALHGLRRSEVFAVTKHDVRGGFIYVEGSCVQGEDGFEIIETNKNSGSRRKVPIMINKLWKLVNSLPIPEDEQLVDMNPNDLYTRINEVCREAGVPEVGVHGLRKTYASILYAEGIGLHEAMQFGGWSDFATMQKIYVQISNDQLTDAAKKLKHRFTNKITNKK